MNLKKIELYGFKSFADRLVIDFKSNITAIVGPNGCGKSNFADAVRWVLGEQSPSVLRCKKMSEVIFSGTTSRRSLSYCEVSLYLDNEQKLYPVDYDEVVITRKLYRNGESEYYINKNVCRLKDIIDLFRDSGIGREGYSIIGQGKIEEILSQKPEARRQIFEEAAGISRHKARKLETERKLIRTRDNISRISDILAEIESKLAPLEKEAKDASRARELKNQLKILEISHFLFQCENSSAERAKVKARLAKVVSKLEECIAEQKRLNSDYNLAMLDVANSDNYANRLRDKITDLMLAAERKAGDSRVIAERLANLTSEAETISAEIAAANARLALRQAEREEKIALFNEKNVLLIEKKRTSEELTGSFAALQADVAQQEKTLEKSREKLITDMDKLSGIDKERVKLELERDMLLDSIKEGKTSFDEKKTELDKVSGEQAKLKAELEGIVTERNTKLQEKALADKNFFDSSTELKDTLAKKSQLESLLRELNLGIKFLEDYIRDYSGYGETVRRLMSAAGENKRISSLILGTVGEVIDVPKDLQLAIEIALGGAIQNIITQTEYDASELIDFLKEKGLGRATFLPLSAVKANPINPRHQEAEDEDGAVGIASELIRTDKRFDNIMSNLLGRTLIVEDKESAIRIAKKYGYAFRIVTLDGAIFQQSGAMTGGSPPSKSTRILSRETELEELYKKRKNTTKELEILVADIQDLTAENSELERALKIIEARIHRLDIDVEGLQAKIAAVESEVLRYKSELDKLMQGSGAAYNKIEELEKHISAAVKSSTEISAEKTSADDFISETREKFIRDKERLDAVSKSATAAVMEVTAVQNELDNINRDLGIGKADISNLNIALLDLKARRITNEKGIKEAQAQIDTTVYTDEEKAELEKMKAELVALDEHKKNMQQQITNLDAAKNEASELYNKITTDKIREESALERIDIDIENLSVRVSQDYDLDYEAAKEFKNRCETPIEFDPSRAAPESLSLRRKIERIGPVNELAEEQFLSESERYQTLKERYDDLVRAEKDLLSIIAELTEEMIQKFTENFKKINDNFQEVFKELFGGGSAKLELEKEDGVNVLDAGIEIMAEPPGKKLNRISLLSGGERALTAIAILFAIIKLKPMPFSILDEVEAALDEGNATRFARYLRKFSKDTQFVVVTHRKPTMELADMLYGVTMENMGVSKLVSVKLEDALSTAEQGEGA